MRSIGDTYVCTTDEHLFPQNPQPPAEHDGAKKTRKVNAHPSTRQDVASFVVEYICRDVRDTITPLLSLNNVSVPIDYSHYRCQVA